MGTYATNSNVQSRNPYRELTSTSKPSTTDVDGWIAEAEAMLTSTLRSNGCTVPVTSADGLLLMRAWVVDYAEALVRMAYAAAGGDGGNEDGRKEYDRFMARLDDIRSNPANYEMMLTASTSSSGTTTRIRGYVLNNDDDKTIDNGDFEPEFEKGTDWY